MFRARFCARIIENSTRLASRSQTVAQTQRYAGNYRRSQHLIVPGNKDKVAEVRSRLQKERSPLSSTEWLKYREEVMNNSKYVNEINVDATLLGLCNADTQLRVAQSYVDFLRSEGKEPNLATIGRILRMYYPAFRKGELQDRDQRDILEIYRKIRKEHEIIDPTTCENLIAALIITPHWKDSLELLDMIKYIAQPTVQAYSALIRRAFENPDDFDVGWKLLVEMCQIGKQPKCEIFIQYFKTISASPETFSTNLDKMLTFIGDNSLVVSQLVTDRLKEVGKPFKYSARNVTLTKVGFCNACKQHQPNIQVSPDEFEQLSSSFMDRVLIRKNVFLKSTPEEVDKFVKFIDRTAPYDCVIDGLNVAFSTGVKKPHSVYAQILTSVINYFKARDKNILVLGRQHMNKWPQNQMRYIRQNASLFLTGNLSQDDPFLLYATLKSGPKADFVSRDLMRSHAHLLGPELKQIFRCWQQEHQYMVISVNDFGKVIIKGPTKYSITASKINSTWHIPYKAEYSITPPETFEVPENWLCLSTSQTR